MPRTAKMSNEDVLTVAEGKERTYLVSAESRHSVLRLWYENEKMEVHGNNWHVAW